MTKQENEERLQRLKEKVSALPKLPGSYQFYDKERNIIYVGKAKNLKNRVSSYFLKEVDRYKTKILVSKIYDITYTVVGTEEDALLLENSLIKQFTPKYNILLKDGKTYPSICVTNEPLPRIISTRHIDKRAGMYFGPYSHIPTMNALLDVIKKIYRPRGCNTKMSLDGILDKRYKRCFKYDMHLCDAPCEMRQSIEKYRENIKDAIEILKGNTRDIEKKLKKIMLLHAENLEYEKAEEIKEKLILIQGYCSKSEVVSHTIDNIDVFAIEKDDNIAYLNYIHVKKGSVNIAFTFEYRNAENETEEDILEIGIIEMRERFGSKAKEVIIPFNIGLVLKDVTFTIPQKGDKRRLLELSKMNVQQYKFDRLKRAEKLNPEQRTTRLLKEIKEKLKLPKLPIHIECFDNSNLSGTNAVGVCIVYKKLKPSKNDYRKYNIKTVEGPDDYASMKEVVYRRYSRMIDEEESLPDLIITDGGKGQMKVVREIVEKQLHLDIPIIGLAKDNRHRTNEILVGNPPVIVGIDSKSDIFKIFTQIQVEVDRFAKTVHRDKRSKKALHSELDDIKGIGPKTKELLIKEFKTIKNIKNADFETLSKIIGENKSKILLEHFKSNQ